MKAYELNPVIIKAAKAAAAGLAVAAIEFLFLLLGVIC